MSVGNYFGYDLGIYEKEAGGGKVIKHALFAKRVQDPLVSTSWLPAATLFFFFLFIIFHYKVIR